MSMTDPIADMLTRIRNGQQASKKTVLVPASKVGPRMVDLFADRYANTTPPVIGTATLSYVVLFLPWARVRFLS